MMQFWNWFDGLEKNQSTLRFLIFLTCILMSYIIMPSIIAFVYGIRYFSLASQIGICIMALLALSKLFKWPR